MILLNYLYQSCNQEDLSLIITKMVRERHFLPPLKKVRLTQKHNNYILKS